MLNQNSIHEINLRLSKAEHILTQTYPLLKDPRILLGVLENIYLAVNDIITHKLDDEFKNLNEEEKYNLFKSKFSKDVEFVKEIKTLWQMKKDSTVDFVKNNQLYLCSDEYDFRILSEKEMKKLLSKAKLLIKT